MFKILLSKFQAILENKATKHFLACVNDSNGFHLHPDGIFEEKKPPRYSVTFASHLHVFVLLDPMSHYRMFGCQPIVVQPS